MPVGELANANQGVIAEALEGRVLSCSDDEVVTHVLGSAPHLHEYATVTVAALTSTATSTPGSAVLRIDSGGVSTPYADSAGHVWSADSGFVGGAANASLFDVSGTTDDALYASRRTGSFSYANPVSNGNYVLRLLFSDYLPAGQRKFNVNVEGNAVLSNFDITASGGGHAALVKEFPVSITDGRLDMTFTPVVGYAAVSGFELLTSPAPAWSGVAPAPQTLFESQGTANNGRLFVFGGFYNAAVQATRAAYAYSPSSNSWQRLADMPTPVTHAGCLSDGNTVWIVGGLVGDYPNDPPTADVWKYDVMTNTYSRGPSLPAARGAGGLVLVGRKLHYFGGLKDGFVDASEHYVLDLDSGATSWTTAAPLPNPRNHLGATVLNGKIYAIGGQHGRDETTQNQSTVQTYDPATDTWKSVASLPKPRSHFGNSTFVVNGAIWIVGGVTQGRTPLSDVTRYDPVSNTWKEIEALPAARKAPVGRLINGKVYITTGSLGDNAPQVTTWVRTAM
jgi:hypothetical protein